MANEQKGPTPVESAENLLRELKQRAEAAHKANDIFTLTLMSELIKVTSPIVTKAVNRYHREERARINQLRQQLRESSPNQRGQSPDQPRPNATTRLGD
jgi:predicted N-acyltransferase